MRTSRLARVRVACAAATVLPIAALDIAVAQAGTAPTCFGRAATIVGSSGATRVDGTAGPDVIFSRWDDQDVHGFGGNDLLCGHSNIFGGPGDDRMRVRSEKAFLDFSGLYGGPGNDVIYRDEALTDDPHFELETDGGRGHDRLYGGPNLDLLRGGPGSDRIFGRGLNDHLAGGPGPDFLVGGGAGDLLRGKSGDDRLRGGGRSDTLRGGPGNDTARGGAGDDRIWGGAGVDAAFGGADVDTCREAEEAHCELP